MGDPLTRFTELSREDQAYLRGGLITHLLRVPLLGRAHEVLVRIGAKRTENAWEAIRTATGDFSGYLSDIMRVWAGVERAGCGCDGIEAEASCVWYAALLASQVSRATILPPSFALALCTDGVWSGEAGVSYALRLPERKDRAAFLAALRSLLPADLVARVDLELHALGDDSPTRSESTAWGHIDESAHKRTQADDRRVKVDSELLEIVNALAPSDTKKLDKNLAHARRLAKEDRNRAVCAASLAEIALALQRLGDESRSTDHWNRAIEYADQSKNKHERAPALRELLSRLEPGTSQADRVLSLGRSAALDFANASDKAEALLRLAASTTEKEAGPLVEQAVELAETLNTPAPQTELLVLASRVAPKSARSQYAERAARRLLDIPERATQMQLCLEVLVQLDNAKRRAELLQAVAHNASVIGDRNHCVGALAALAVGQSGRLGTDSVTEVLNQLRKVRDPEIRAHALEQLAPAVSPNQRQLTYKLLEAIYAGGRFTRQNTDRKTLAAAALWAVARHADQPERAARWKQAWDLSWSRELAVDAPAEYHGEVWRAALITRFNILDKKIATRIRDELDLEDEVQHWKEARANLFQSCSGGIDSIAADWFIRQWVPRSLFAEALEEERQRLLLQPGGDAYSNRSCIAELFRNAAEQCLPTAKAFVISIQKPDLRIYLLEPLAERMSTESESFAAIALAALEEIDRPEHRLKELINLAKSLAPAHRGELLTRIREYLPRESFWRTSLWEEYLPIDPAFSAALLELAWSDWKGLDGKRDFARQTLALALYPYLDAARANECRADIQLLADGRYTKSLSAKARNLLGCQNPPPQSWNDAWAMLLENNEPLKVLETLVARITAGDLPGQVMPAHIWQALLRRHALAGRAKLIELLNTVAPVIEVVVGPHARATAYSAVAAVMAWWE